MENQTNVQTSVQQVDVDIDSWLGAPGAESIVTPTADEAKKPDAKPSIFSSKEVDLSFIDQEDKPEEVSKTEEKGSTENKDTEVPISRETSTNVFDELDQEEEDEKKPKGGRPRTEKSGLVEFLKKRIESKEMFAFDDYDESKQSLDDYLGGLGEKI